MFNVDDLAALDLDRLWYDRVEIARLICVHPHTINAWRKVGRFPEPAINRQSEGIRFVRWTRQQFQEWIKGMLSGEMGDVQASA